MARNVEEENSKPRETKQQTLISALAEKLSWLLLFVNLAKIDEAENRNQTPTTRIRKGIDPYDS